MASTEDSTVKEAILQDLEIQWRDHFHMRDQTWKVLFNSMLFFLGVVGLEMKDVEPHVMIPAYVALAFVGFMGWRIAKHHRVRQSQKFAMIREYEEQLGLLEIKRRFIDDDKHKDPFLGRVFTAKFIELMEIGILLMGIVFLVAEVWMK